MPKYSLLVHQKSMGIQTFTHNQKLIGATLTRSVRYFFLSYDNEYLKYLLDWSLYHLNELFLFIIKTIYNCFCLLFSNCTIFNVIKGPRACYDEGKRVAETLTYAYAKQENMQVRVARIFNTFGPRMHMNDGRVVSNFILQALQGEDVTVSPK